MIALSLTMNLKLAKPILKETITKSYLPVLSTTLEIAFFHNILGFLELS